MNGKVDNVAFKHNKFQLVLKMNSSLHDQGYFEIAREKDSISVEDFIEKYFIPEKPVIIESIASDWKARKRWNQEYLKKQVARETGLSAGALWYWMERGTMEDDYQTPTFIKTLLDDKNVFPRKQPMRIWAHEKGNVSDWHYDAGMINIFNTQVVGRKEWFLVSPETPIDCYPFTHFAIKNKDENILCNKKYTHFFLNEGDMLFMPPLWFHKVIAEDSLNISLNWIFTKKETQVASKALERDFERSALQHYLHNHPSTKIRLAVKKIDQHIPSYLRSVWRYKELIKTPLPKRKFGLLRRTLSEIAMFGKVLLHLRATYSLLNRSKAQSAKLSK